MTDTPPRQVRVTFRKAVSDGNYGTESAEVMLEWWSDAAANGDADSTTAETMLQDARGLVHAELARSPNPRVRDALQLPLPARVEPPASDPDPEELPF